MLYSLKIYLEKSFYGFHKSFMLYCCLVRKVASAEMLNILYMRVCIYVYVYAQKICENYTTVFSFLLTEL